MNTSSTPLKIFKGTDAAVSQVPQEDGSLLFAYDSGKIYLDTHSNRYSMGAAGGATFLYTDEPVNTVDETSTLTLSQIRAEKLKIDDIVVSGDNVICRVIAIDYDNDLVEVIMLAAGGGGSGSGKILTLNPVKGFEWPEFVIPSMPIQAKYKLTTNMTADNGASANINISVAHYNANGEKIKELLLPDYQSMRIRVDEEFIVTIPANTFEYTMAYETRIVLTALYDEQSKRNTNTISVYNVSFRANPTGWKEQTKFYLNGTNTQKGISFGYLFDGINENMKGYIKAYVSNILVYESNTPFVTKDTSIQITERALSDGGIQHGAHELRIEGYVIINGQYNLIKTLIYNIMLIDVNSDVPIIISPYVPPENGELNYTIIDIPFMVYEKNKSQSSVRLYINGQYEGNLLVTSSENTYALWQVVKYNPNQFNTFRITCGDTAKAFEVFIIENAETEKLNPITTGLILDLNSQGRSNNETAKARQTWQYRNAENIVTHTAQFKDFNWYNNGWISDNYTDNLPALRLTNGASLTIPIPELFSDEPGKDCTIDIEFKPRNVLEFARLITSEEKPKKDASGNLVYDKDGNLEYEMEYTVHTDKGVIGSFYNGTAGFCIGTQEAFIKSDKKIASARYAEDNFIKLTFVIQCLREESNGQTSGILFVYLNGVMSGATLFEGDSFNANTSNLVFNSNYCDLDLYRIKVYNRALNYGEITQNWAADAKTLQEKRERYELNGAIVGTNSNGDTVIDFDKVRYNDHNTMPIMVLTTYPDPVLSTNNNVVYDKLPYNKDIKIIGDVRFYHPLFNGLNGTEQKGFRAQRVELAVQGTSSQGYPRRNYKIKLKNPQEESVYKWNNVEYTYKLQEWDGEEADVKKNIWDGRVINKYNMSLEGDDLTETPFCLKADYMESSSTHNTGMANFVHYLTTSMTGTIDNTYVEDYDLRHPLVRQGIMNNGDARTTIYGYPILLFHDKKGSNEAPEFIGKYNFNLDKGATDVFGFSNGEVNEFTPVINRDTEVEVEKVNEETGETETVTETQQIARKGTYEEVAECWELKNNKGTRCSFLTPPVDFFDEEENSDGRLAVAGDFEPRYLYSDIDPEKMYKKANGDSAKVAEANAIITQEMQNLYKLYTWVYSTNPDNASPTSQLDTPYWIYTQDNSYTYNAENPKKYYLEQGNTSKYIYYTYDASLDVAELITMDNSSIISSEKYTPIQKVTDKGIQREYEYSLNGVKDTQKNVSSLEKLKPNYTWYEYYTHDTAAYRLAKFKNEFELHFNKPYCIFYYVMTNFLIMFDSRSKNMMLASWGPEKENGDYIWYPIFYDMDTQLGVNNSGVVYWDYDCEPDDPVKPIYSGASSVLWRNIHSCFGGEAQAMYQTLRSNDLINKNKLISFYQDKGSKKWSEAVKNADAFFKYIAPALSVADGYGYIDQSGKQKGDDFTYLYCLQGDRALQQETLFTNRLNYKDSQYSAGSYISGEQGGSNIQMRYNANEPGDTSDPTCGESASDSPLESNAAYDITTYLTQYCTIFLDTTPVRPFARYDANNGRPVHIMPPIAQQNAIQSGANLQQQLIYIYGPEYVKSLGDLSTKYLDELKLSNAERLRELIVGNDYPGYYNKKLTGTDKLVIGGENKQLLSIVDMTNLTNYVSSVNLSSCIKLEKFKGLGTQITAVDLPTGSIFNTVYLPNTITELILLTPQELTTVLHDPTLVGYDARMANGGKDHEGLYVQGLTDLISITDDGVYTYAKPEQTSLIRRFQTENTKLDFETYVLLDILTQSRYEAYQALAGNTEAQKSMVLLISMKDVKWTPFKRLESDALYQDYSHYTLYYLGDDCTYKEYNRQQAFYEGNSPSTDKWLHCLLGQGVWIKDNMEKYELIGRSTPYDSSKTYYTYNSDTNTYDVYEYSSDTWNTGSIYRKYALQNPIQDLSLLDYYRVKDDGNNCLKDIDTSINKIPTITGEMHVRNTMNTKLNEYELYSKYRTAFPDLNISADYIEPCARAKFVEYLPDKTIKVYGTFKAANATDKMQLPVYTEEDPAPAREHYNFLGWTKTDISSQYCVVTSNVEVPIIKNTAEAFANETFEDNPTYYAVFMLKGYTVKVLDNDSGLPVYDKYLQNGQEVPVEVMIVSGQQIGTAFDVYYPYRDSSGLADDKVWKFKGYKRSQSGEILNSINTITVLEDMILYAVFEEDSVYNNPLTDAEITIYYLNDQYAFDVLPGIRGKICVPRQGLYNGRKIDIQTTIAGSSISNSGGYNLPVNPNLTHIYFMPDSVITSIGRYGCANNVNLKHIDIPLSLTNIDQGAFNKCSSLVLSNLNNINWFGGNTFSNLVAASENVIIGAGTNMPNTITFNGYDLAQSNIVNIQLGSPEKPLSGITFNSTGKPTFGGAINGVTSSTLPQSITAYITADLDIATITALISNNCNGNAETTISVNHATGG